MRKRLPDFHISRRFPCPPITGDSLKSTMPQFSEIAIATAETTSDRTPLTTCADCLYFAPDQGVHGWCQTFDKPARPHHDKTKSCDQEIEVLEHNSHIPEPGTEGQQSQGTGHVPPTQSHKKDPLTRKSCYVVAQVLSYESQRDISWDEIETIAIANDMIWVNLTYNRTIQIAVEKFRSIRRRQLEQQARVEADMDVAGVLELSEALTSEHSGLSSEHLGFNSEHYEPSSEHLQRDSEHYALGSEHYSLDSEHYEPSSEHYRCDFKNCSPSLQNFGTPDNRLSIPDNSPGTPDNSSYSPDNNSYSPDIEVDSDESPMNPTYRVWFSWHFLGSFHQSPVDGRWLTNPTYGRDYQRHTTPQQAVAAIAACWDHAQNLRAADQGVAS